LTVQFRGSVVHCDSQSSATGYQDVNEAKRDAMATTAPKGIVLELDWKPMANRKTASGAATNPELSTLGSLLSTGLSS
jgi:hypothetical protein